MRIILINAAGSRVETEYDTPERALGAIGSKVQVICDGVAGHFEFLSVDSTVVRFVQTDDVMQFFAYTHLPEHLRGTSKIFYDAAERVALTLPPNEQRKLALQRLKEAKDAAVCAKLAKQLGVHPAHARPVHHRADEHILQTIRPRVALQTGQCGVSFLIPAR